MRLKLIWIGETRNRHFAALEEDYYKRIKRFLPCERIAIAEEKKSDRHSTVGGLAKEARSLRKKLQNITFKIALDESGDELQSQELASLFQKWMLSGIHEVALIVGGVQGRPTEIDDQLNMKLSLSQFTLPHELARVVLLEQVYRAFSLIRGMPYHK